MKLSSTVFQGLILSWIFSYFCDCASSDSTSSSCLLQTFSSLALFPDTLSFLSLTPYPFLHPMPHAPTILSAVMTVTYFISSPAFSLTLGPRCPHPPGVSTWMPSSTPKSVCPTLKSQLGPLLQLARAIIFLVTQTQTQNSGAFISHGLQD